MGRFRDIKGIARTTTIAIIIVILIVAAVAVYYATLPPPKVPLATITGKVTDAKTGSPVAGAAVTADGYGTTTGSDGTYSLSVKLGKYTVKVVTTGYEAKTASVDAAEEKTYTANVPMTPIALPGPATITGKVTDAKTGLPVAGATVKADGYGTTTGTDGVYSLKVTFGKYTITVSMKGYEAKTASVDAAEEKTYTANVPMTPLIGLGVKIAVVSDIGGRGDLSFNDMAFKGGDDADRDFGVEMVELISKVEADYVPNLVTAAKDPKVQLIVGVGFLLSDALVEVARKYPTKNFAGIDTYSQSIVQGKYPAEYPLPNLMDIVYEEHKGSALVGALGALLAAYYGKPYIGGVFGIEIPVLWKFEIGYKWGCDWAINWTMKNRPELKAGIVATPRKERVLWTYTGTFSDITKGYEAAKPMYAKDAVAVYNIAGPLGLGINQAVAEIAKAKNLKSGPPFWIGVDANQDWINPGFVIASMMKRVDYGVYYATKLVLEKKFRDVVKEGKGSMTLGIGTTWAGVPMEGISVSTLADLDEFIAMGVRAEELTGEKVLPMPPDQIRATCKAMREAQPAWIWDAMAELEKKIRTGEVVVPLAFTKEVVDYWRGIFG